MRLYELLEILGVTELSGGSNQQELYPLLFINYGRFPGQLSDLSGFGRPVCRVAG